ncbi:MAG: LacI family DNA-binding transcriptional regulator [Chloroflexi bacterium]|nr:LacI family DNA-binding transcriptional regulator [Chloroflexota bacterium]
MTKKNANFRNESRSITIADVARVAGVSVPTVSRILNDKEYVAEETRQRVHEAIRTLGYAPHTQARRLRGGVSMTLALHHPIESPHELSSVIEIPYVTGAAAAASEKEYFLNFLVSQLNPESILNMYRSNQIDGIILLQVCMDDWRVNLLRENNYPFVMIGRCANLEGLSFIDLDFENAMLQAFDYLIELGHQNIGFLTYPQSWRKIGIGPAIRSLEGYKHALNKYGLHGCYREIGLNSVEEGFEGTNDLLQENPELTAIITVSHLTAAGSIKALALHGRNVPQDCSVMVTGFGGNFANVVTPSLTTLEWSPYEISYQATILMTEKLANKELPAQQILIPPKLVVRESMKEVR